LGKVYNLRASMISRVIGTDAYCSRQNHFEILVGNKEDKPVNEEYVAHGNECEKYGIAQVMITTGELVRNCGSELLGEQINTEHPIEAPYLYGMQGYEERKHSAFKLIPSSFGKDVKINLSCTPDGYIGEESLVEVKAPYFVQDDFDKYIQRYLPQVYFQQFLTNRKHTYFCIYQMNNSKVFSIPYNKDYVDNFMLPKVIEFATYLCMSELDKNFKTKRNSKEDFIYKGKCPYTEITNVKKVANV